MDAICTLLVFNDEWDDSCIVMSNILVHLRASITFEYCLIIDLNSVSVWVSVNDSADASPLHQMGQNNARHSTCGRWMRALVRAWATHNTKSMRPVNANALEVHNTIRHTEPNTHTHTPLAKERSKQIEETRSSGKVPALFSGIFQCCVFFCYFCVSVRKWKMERKRRRRRRQRWRNEKHEMKKQKKNKKLCLVARLFSIQIESKCNRSICNVSLIYVNK